ncbi:Crp/Fnr family transcriptional regulator [Paucibacter sp. APW11]|uniref:Crp/Fnr family transcriptional regulator n=1 Tax=Roseateles aquae TaxID=3077235 RepID=A0ABU3PI66_9BURK|nr:Crp/Fnr family transcriptional regulator [Paucibacter sp. APW11]MDT9001798.1 Crp/Fnr family transcriptional regulator [Paucibacter sp. APW11]
MTSITSDKTGPGAFSPAQAAQVLQALLGIVPGAATWPREPFMPLLGCMCWRELKAGQTLWAMGATPAQECLVLEGMLRSWVGDAEGRAVTLSFHRGPCAMTPAIARSVDGRSRTQCDALSEVRVVLFDAEALHALMVADPTVRQWGDQVLRAELLRRAEREWSLAVLPARERLLALRRELPGLEQQVAHHHIASYLGITPVSLSRLRAQLQREA